MQESQEIKIAKSAIDTKLNWLLHLNVSYEKTERLLAQRHEQLTLLTQDEKNRVKRLWQQLYQLSEDVKWKIKHDNIKIQLLQTLKNTLEGKLSLEALKNQLEQIKQEERAELIKTSPYFWFAIGFLLASLLFGIAALVIYLFNPLGWIEPFVWEWGAWAGILQVFCVIASPLFVISSVIFFKLFNNDRERTLKLGWEGENSLQTVGDALDTADVQLLQKVNSKEWQAEFEAAKQKLAPLTANTANSTPFDPVLNPIPQPTSPIDDQNFGLGAQTDNNYKIG